MDWGEAAPDAPVEHDFAVPEGGRYERGGERGGGGMGRVVTAHDRRLGRDVALKEVVTHAAAGSEASRRLAREAAITAGLDHPAIVPVFDAGVGEDGQLYYTMRLIRGRTLGRAISEAPTLADRLGLLRHYLDVCEAMAFAHSLGVIHRDLKPENVMVGEFGETQVMDWGLARAPDSADETMRGALSGPGRTQLGAVIGTPAYMSPEQARGEPADKRSDVWSLGVVLRELLTGEVPYEGMSSHDVLAAVRTASLSPAGPGLAQAPDELIAISERALQSEPESRYRSAQELAEDVARYIDGRLVAAHRYTPLDHLRRLVRAWRAPLAVGLVAVIALTAFVVVAYQRNSAERERATAAEQETSKALDLADHRLGVSLASHAKRAYELGAWPEAELLAAHSLDLVETPGARGVLAGVTTVARGTRQEAAALPPGSRVALSADGALLLCVDQGQLSLWGYGEESPRWTAAGTATWAQFDLEQDLVHVVWEQRLETRSLADGRSLFTAPVGGGGGINLTSRATEPGTNTLVDSRLVRVLGPDGVRTSTTPCGEHDITAAAATDRGFLLACDHGALRATDGRGERLRRWSALGELTGDFVTSIAPDEGGDRLLVGRESGQVHVVDLTADRITHHIDTGDDPVSRLRWLSDDRVAVSAERAGVRVWSLAAGVWVERFPRDASPVFGLDRQDLVILGRDWTRWSFDLDSPVPGVKRSGGLTAARVAPDERTLVTTHGDGAIHVWELPAGRLRTTLGWQSGVVKDGAFSRDGTRFIAGTVFEGIRWYETEGWTPRSGPSDRAGLTRRLVSLEHNFVGLQWGVRHMFRLGLEPTPIERMSLGDAGVMHDASARKDGSGAVFLGEQGVLRWLDDGGALLQPLSAAPGARAVATAHRSPRLVLAESDGVRLVERESGRELLRYGDSEDTVLDVVVSPGDRWVAAGTLEGAVQIWDLSAGTLLLTLDMHDRRVAGVEFEPSGNALWTASWDGSARRIDLSDLLTPARDLITRAEGRWGTSLEQALDVKSR